jgi:hypothetical protein
VSLVRQFAPIAFEGLVVLDGPGGPT